VNSWIDEPQLEQRIGHFFVVIDTARLGSPEWLAGRVADFAAIVHGTPAANPSQPVRLPGEREMSEMKRQQRDGIEVDGTLVKKLQAWAAKAP
jgi:LDH2 family malate/lactate/ureidoglycolate dehydrogenase